MKRRLLSGGVWAFLGRATIALTSLVSNALLARLLSPQDLGVYFLAFSLVSLGSMVGSLGLNLTVIRFVSESVALDQLRRTRSVIGLIFRLGGSGALGIGLLYLFFGGFIGVNLFSSPALASVTGLVAGWAVVMTLQLLLAETFRGFGDIRSAVVFGGVVTGAVLSVCLGLLWLLEGQATLAAVMLLAVGSGLTSALVASWLLYRKVTSLPPPDPESCTNTGEVLRVAWPLLIAGLTYYALSQADIWILSVFRSEEEVAVYGAAFRIVLLVGMSISIVDAVVPPLIAEMYAQGRRELEGLLRATATLAGLPALLVLAGFILIGGPVLELVYGDAYYRGGATVLAVLSLGQLARTWAGSSGMLLNMTGHQVSAMLFTALSALVAIGLSLIVVNALGMVGVAVAFASGLALQNVAMAMYSRKVVGIRPYMGFSLRAFFLRTGS